MTLPTRARPDSSSASIAPSSATDERGFTLIELLVYCSLFVLILTIVGGVLINTMQNEGRVRDASAASSAGQLVAQSVKRGVANATDISHVVNADGSERIIVHTRNPDSPIGFSCEAWEYVPNADTHPDAWVDADEDGSIFRKRVAPVSSASVWGPQQSGWILLATGVKPVGSSVFTAIGPRVDLRFSVDAGAAQPVLISTTVHQRVPGAESTACF
ncbi:hypothetical protein ASC66_03725 [Leifsonia sp. Root4]|uniref:PulJ/GspJ family protein n=1 Tax=Leifsonia sp. Root4 TaxID=1736525 RepID=UPI0006F8F04B|nr:type II secretion system protein [Leifsonia sp. Root4]KQW08066.1 hypothetical protein ASC66_03725 [Leifsonia sp. Root4]